MNTYRHGDLSFIQLDKLPDDVKKMKTNKSFILALGEHTGHKHVITAEKGIVQLLTTTNGKTVLVIGDTAILTHEEHAPITFVPGIYEMGNEQEYDWFSFSSRQVVD